MTNIVKRKSLLALFLVFLMAGLLLATIPFIRSCNPSELAKSSAMETVSVDLGGMKDGEIIKTVWKNKPIIILKRSKEVIEQLQYLNEKLYDPLSVIDEDLPYILKGQRSIKPEYFIGVNISTYCGCALKYTEQWGNFTLPGGLFYDPCHIGTYDAAGRLLADNYVEKPSGPCSGKMTNMIVPPHMFVSDTQLLIGDRAK